MVNKVFIINIIAMKQTKLTEKDLVNLQDEDKTA